MAEKGESRWRAVASKAKLTKGKKSLLGKWRGNGLVRQGTEAGEEGSPSPREEEQKSIRSPAEVQQKSSWSEHVWSTFIHRGFADDVTDTVSRSPSLLLTSPAGGPGEGQAPAD